MPALACTGEPNDLSPAARDWEDHADAEARVLEQLARLTDAYGPRKAALFLFRRTPC